VAEPALTPAIPARGGGSESFGSRVRNVRPCRQQGLGGSAARRLGLGLWLLSR
jgi:hypothetical protein